MKELLSASLLAPIFILFSSCGKSPSIDLNAERSAILELHNKQRDYHFQKDSIAFANQLSENFVSVNRGEISQPDRQATIARYYSYFSMVDFAKWDDLSEPIIRISDDGTMAFTVVDKEVIVNYKDEEGILQESKTHFAWTAVYRKYEGEWKVDCVTSTNVSN